MAAFSMALPHSARTVSAAAHPSSARSGGWFVDLDTIWLRPSRGLRAPSMSGHVFGSMRATPNGLPFGGDVERHWKVKWVTSPGEQCWLCGPMCFPQASAVLQAGVAAADSLVLGQKPVPYLTIMNAIRVAAQEEVWPRQRRTLGAPMCVRVRASAPRGRIAQYSTGLWISVDARMGVAVAIVAV